MLIVDLDARLVERWTSDAERPEICPLTLSWQPQGVADQCVIDIVELMREVHGD